MKTVTIARIYIKEGDKVQGHNLMQEIFRLLHSEQKVHGVTVFRGVAGFGSKGQKARSGVKHAGFEGGQMPLARRLPKVGFNNIFATQYAIVNVADLEAAFNAGDVVDTEALKAKGLVKKTLDGVKVLGNGELTKALTVKAAAYSASAKEKIEKAGGKAEVM